MNFDMFSDKRMDDTDSNYIYPKPYIDPSMYMNPYYMGVMPPYGQQRDQNMSIEEYVTYMNPFMNNPMLSPEDIDDYEGYVEYPDIEESEEVFNSMTYNMPNQNMYGMMPNGFMPGMMPMPNMMMPGAPGAMPQNMPMMMFPGMMMPGMMPNMYMMPGMPPINMEEFDEEEM